jgi:hypothetical protein
VTEAEREALLLLMRYVENLEGGLAADRSQHSATASRLAELRELILRTDAPSQRSDPDVK